MVNHYSGQILFDLITMYLLDTWYYVTEADNLYVTKLSTHEESKHIVRKLARMLIVDSKFIGIGIIHVSTRTNNNVNSNVNSRDFLYKRRK